MFHFHKECARPTLLSLFLLFGTGLREKAIQFRVVDKHQDCHKRQIYVNSLIESIRLEKILLTSFKNIPRVSFSLYSDNRLFLLTRSYFYSWMVSKHEFTEPESWLLIFLCWSFCRSLCVTGSTFVVLILSFSTHSWHLFYTKTHKGSRRFTIIHPYPDSPNLYNSIKNYLVVIKNIISCTVFSSTIDKFWL